MRFIRKAGAPSEKSPKKLYVEPAELARKLVKEMDDHVVERGERLVARSRYTIYLCPEDYNNLQVRMPQVIGDLRAKLAKHAESMEYLVPGELRVDFALDEELELGYFGILAQKASSRQAAAQMQQEYVPEVEPQMMEPTAPAPFVAPAAAASGAAESLWDVEPAAQAAPAVMPAAQAAPPSPFEDPAAARAFTPPSPDRPGGPRTARAAAAAEAAAAVAARSAAAEVPRAAQAPAANPTQVMPAGQADELGLEGRVIMITSGDQVVQFRQSRVIIGRSKEADLRVNDPNVSRKHAAVYWNNGRLMIDDLGSTNGTMVNGYPVTRTMLRPTDVVAIGEGRLTVEGR